MALICRRISEPGLQPALWGGRGQALLLAMRTGTGTSRSAWLSAASSDFARTEQASQACLTASQHGTIWAVLQKIAGVCLSLKNQKIYSHWPQIPELSISLREVPPGRVEPVNGHS